MTNQELLNSAIDKANQEYDKIKINLYNTVDFTIQCYSKNEKLVQSVIEFTKYHFTLEQFTSKNREKDWLWGVRNEFPRKTFQMLLLDEVDILEQLVGSTDILNILCCENKNFAIHTFSTLEKCIYVDKIIE